MINILGLEYPISKFIYENANRITEKVTKIINLALIKIICPGLIISQVLITFYVYLTTNLDNNAFNLAVPIWYVLYTPEIIIYVNFLFVYMNFRLPFDWKNPSGFLIASILIFMLMLNTFMFMACELSTGIGTYVLVTSLTKDLKNNFSSFSQIVKSKSNAVKLMKQLIDLIQYHSTGKRFGSGILHNRYILNFPYTQLGKSTAKYSKHDRPKKVFFSYQFQMEKCRFAHIYQ